MTDSPEREIGREMVGAMHHSTGSFELVGGAIVAACVGFALDRVLGLTPVLTTVFALAGFAGATYSIWFNYRTKMAVAHADRAQRREQGSSS